MLLSTDVSLLYSCTYVSLPTVVLATQNTMLAGKWTHNHIRHSTEKRVFVLFFYFLLFNLFENYLKLSFNILRNVILWHSMTSDCWFYSTLKCIIVSTLRCCFKNSSHRSEGTIFSDATQLLYWLYLCTCHLWRSKREFGIFN